MIEINTKGLNCPQPVIKTKEAVDKGEKEITVIIDNKVALSNVTRFLENKGYTIKTEEKNNDYIVKAEIQREIKIEKQEDNGKIGDYSVLLLSDKLGADSNGLGEVLMKAYIGTLSQADKLPKVIALMNSAVMMSLPENSVSDTLKEISDNGVKILVCGTCTKHFGITEQITVGTISNMFEITEEIFAVAKPLIMG
ncbi:MAG: sulfurtransferase-like selenium metabolism protein YedF [Synergistaceae bacterium]